MVSTQDDTMHLVQRAQAGETEDFAALVESHEREIYGFLLGLLGDPDEALDVAQQVFLKAWLRLHTLKDASHFKAWLYTIARNTTYDFWRARKGQQQSLEHPEAYKITDNMTGPEERVLQQELIALALAGLSPKLKQCLLLRVVGGLSHEEIASIVGIGETSVSTYVSMARRQFCEVYQRLEQGLEEGDEVNA